MDEISLEGYKYVHQTRKQKFLRKSGGIGVFVRNEMCQNIELMPSSSDYVLWLKLFNKASTCKTEIILGVVYQPPESSKYCTEDEMQLLDVEISSMCIENKFVFMLGDFNARIAKMDDFVEADPFIADYFEFDDVLYNYFNKSDILKLSQMSKTRVSQDNIVNKLGVKLIYMCKSNNLFILNSRCGEDREIGKLTFRDISIIDYAIASADSLGIVKHFKVEELDPLFSDGHSLLHLNIEVCDMHSKSRVDRTNTQKQTLWNDYRKSEFVVNLDKEMIKNTLTSLNAMREPLTTISF